MKTIFTLFLLLLFNYGNSKAQSGLTLKAGIPFFVTAGNTVSIDGLVLQPSSGFTISAPNSIARNTTIINTAPQPYIIRVFKWANTTAPFSGIITIYYQDAELNSIPETALTLNIHNGIGWTAYPAGELRDAANNLVTTSGLTNIQLNELTLAAELNPLPLLWGPVKAYRKNETAYIEWDTYDELNTSYFELERSVTGANWDKIGNTPAANTSAQHHYKLEDISVPASKTLYRIRQVDQDNHFSYSLVVSINAIDKKPEVLIYPNPATDIITIQVKNAPSSIQWVNLFNATGALIKKERQTNMNSSQLNVASLPSGTYRIQLLLADGSSILHSIIKN